MELYVLDTDFNILGIIDDYECLVWNRKYNKPGTFTMQIIPSFEQFQLLKKGNILLKKDNTKEAMYIDYRELEENEKGIEVLIISGYSLSNWLNRRITLYKEIEKGNVETVMKNYVNRHCINPIEINRKIDNLVLGDNNSLGQEIDYVSHYEPLLQELEDISKVNELGYRIDLDLEKRQYIFEVYKGLDRTDKQVENSRAIFSGEFENISNQKYIDSDNNFRNMVLVAGAGEDTKRKIISLGIENKGLDRYELFVDARDISDTKQVGDSEVSIPLEEYNKLLEVRGNEKLSEYTKIQTFDCILNNINSLKYREDFDLGDKVIIINRKWGLVLYERIISIEETYDIEGLNIQIEIGNNIPSLIDKITNKMR